MYRAKTETLIILLYEIWVTQHYKNSFKPIFGSGAGWTLLAL